MNNLSLWSYIKHYKFNSIFIKNFIIISLMVIIPLAIISVGIFNNNNSIIEYEAKTYSMRSLEQAMAVMSNVFNGVDRIAIDISLDDNVQIFTKSPQYTKLNERWYYNITSMIDSLSNAYKAIESIYVYSELNKFIISSQSQSSSTYEAFPDKTWIDLYKNNDWSRNAWVVPRRYSDVYPYFISIIHPIYSDNKVGTVTINLNVKKLSEMLYGNSVKSNENLYIVNNKQVLFSRDQTETGKNIDEIPALNSLGDIGEGSSVIKHIGNEDYVVSTQISSYQDLKFILLVPVNEFTERAGSIRKFLLQIFGAGIVISLFIAFFISLRSYKPLQRIISIMENRDGSIFIYNEENGGKQRIGNELKYIINNITKSMDTAKKQENELARRMDLLKNAQVAALLAQINPHFVHNTLETINMKAVRLNGYDNDISKMITDLSDLLRLSLESDKHLATVMEEVEHAKLYIQIMEQRIDNELTVDWDISHDILDCKIVKICLQPIVENAISHGIKTLKRPGLITMRGWLSNNEVHIEVSDNGTGMSDEKLDLLTRDINNIYLIKGHNIGLSNVNHRIKLIFGEEYGLTVRSQENVGTTVHLIFPYVI